MRWSPRTLVTVALVGVTLIACGSGATPTQPATEVPASTAPASASPANRATPTSSGELVYPSLQAVVPAQAAPGTLVKIRASGGHVRLAGGGFNESLRTFPLTFDGAPFGTISCHVSGCDASVVIPLNTPPGNHRIGVEGGSTIDIQVQ